MAKASELEIFASTVCRLCFETFHENPGHTLLFARGNPQDKAVPSVSIHKGQDDDERNTTIQAFFAGRYRFGAMAQLFPWEEKAAIG